MKLVRTIVLQTRFNQKLGHGECYTRHIYRATFKLLPHSKWARMQWRDATGEIWTWAAEDFWASEPENAALVINRFDDGMYETVFPGEVEPIDDNAKRLFARFEARCAIARLKEVA